jgi:transposase-like protein
MCNLQAKVPEERGREFGPAARLVYQASSPIVAELARQEFVQVWGCELPGAVACFEDDYDACIAHLRLPIGHRPCSSAARHRVRRVSGRRSRAARLKQGPRSPGMGKGRRRQLCRQRRPDRIA